MTMHLAPMPACEELMSGYIPYPTYRGGKNDRIGNTGRVVLAFLLFVPFATTLPFAGQSLAEPGGSDAGDPNPIERAQACEASCNVTSTPDAQSAGE